MKKTLSLNGLQVISLLEATRALDGEHPPDWNGATPPSRVFTFTDPSVVYKLARNLQTLEKMQASLEKVRVAVVRKHLPEGATEITQDMPEYAAWYADLMVEYGKTLESVELFTFILAELNMATKDYPSGNAISSSHLKILLDLIEDPIE